MHRYILPLDRIQQGCSQCYKQTRNVTSEPTVMLINSGVIR